MACWYNKGMETKCITAASRPALDMMVSFWEQRGWKRRGNIAVREVVLSEAPRRPVAEYSQFMVLDGLAAGESTADLG